MQLGLGSELLEIMTMKTTKSDRDKAAWLEELDREPIETKLTKEEREPKKATPLRVPLFELSGVDLKNLPSDDDK